MIRISFNVSNDKTKLFLDFKAKKSFQLYINDILVENAQTEMYDGSFLLLDTPQSQLKCN